MTAIENLRVRIFADGAELPTIVAMSRNPLIKGFTTNPTLMRKAGIRDYRQFACDVLRAVPDLPVSFEVFSDDFEEMEVQALELASWGANVNVKIPVTNTRGEFSGELIKRLSGAGVPLNVTALMTLDQVANRAGISRALVVFHFKSKNKLIEEVLDYLGKEYSEGWDNLVQEESRSFMLKLLRLIDYDIQFACDNPEYVSVWHAFWGEAKGNLLYQQKVLPREERYARELSQLLAKIIEEEAYDKQDLSSITRGLFAMMFGMWVQLHFNPAPDDYVTNSAAIRLYLGKLFPRHPLPENIYT